MTYYFLFIIIIWFLFFKYKKGSKIKAFSTGGLVVSLSLLSGLASRCKHTNCICVLPKAINETRCSMQHTPIFLVHQMGCYWNKIQTKNASLSTRANNDNHKTNTKRTRNQSRRRRQQEALWDFWVGMLVVPNTPGCCHQILVLHHLHHYGQQVHLQHDWHACLRI